MLELRIKKILSQIFNVNIDSIDDNFSPDTISQWNSLGHMNLVIALEEEFGVNFPEDKIVEMLNYPLIVHVVKEVI